MKPEVKAYLKNLPDEQRKSLEHVRSIILKNIPDAEEVITYGMPGFKYKKKYLIAYAGFKDHMSIFPGNGAIERASKQLNGFKTSKGTIQFTSDNQLPNAVIKTVVLDRKNEIEAG